MMDASGNVVNSYTYDQFGAILEQTEGTYNPFKYAGELHDMPDNLIYLRNRIYDPKIGRFLTEDPIKDGTNWYVYCGNNPVNYWDPTGLYYLEIDKNGEVYAIIEPGDTLSDISKSEVNDASAWTKINYEGNPSMIQVGQRIKISEIYDKVRPTSVDLSKSLPLEGAPNSTGKLYNPDGSVKQERVYGPDGRPVVDTDYNHGGVNHQFPHKHEWKNGVRGPAQPVSENKSSDSSETIKKAGIWAAAGTVIYWIISEGSRIFFPPRNLVPVP